MVVTTESKVTINGKFYATGPRYSKTNQPTNPPKKEKKKKETETNETSWSSNIFHVLD